MLDVLLEKDQINSMEIWDIYEKAPRIPQVRILSAVASLHDAFLIILEDCSCANEKQNIYDVYRLNFTFYLLTSHALLSS